MTSRRRAEVLTTSEAREGLNQIAASFTADGPAAVPVIFGSHRKPQAVIMPVGLWELIEDAWDLAQADEALAAHDGTWFTREQMTAELGLSVD